MKNLTILLTLLGSLNTYATEEAAEALGERLFNEFRFSAFYSKVSRGNVNYEIKIGSPVVEEIETLVGTSKSPFAGTATSCASCHMVDQGLDIEGVGMRGYNDSAKRTPILYRKADKRKVTLRNTPTLIGLHSKYTAHNFVHFDGELNGTKATVLGNFTGRNMGWLANEKEQAKRHLLRVIKGDNGKGELASEFGGSYMKIMKGTDPSIEADFKLDPEFRVDVATASDDEILKKIEEYIFIYVRNIDFATDEDGNYNSSAYDQFLIKNNLPTGPREDQSIGNYAAELIRGISKLDKPKYVSAFRLETHDRDTQFGEKELKGLKSFMNISKRAMCVQCHLPPLFSDTLFHNVGVSQVEYESVHGKGSFSKLEVPTLSQKEKEGITYLQIPKQEDPKRADLGAWNFFKSDKEDAFSNYMRELFCPARGMCNDQRISTLLVGRIKTPTLRNLGHSAPYFHDGRKKTIRETVQFYVDQSKSSKKGELVNGAPQLRRMNINDSDVNNISAFIKSLDEEYE